MGVFFNNEKIGLLQKTQENLDLSQKNMELLSRALGVSAGAPIDSDIPMFSDEEKKKAAYALNLCMVSVSQIIDYNDMYILDQEYEAILNNLNLEEMPKDEALLNILKQLLDTITFFRIQDGDKKFLEKEYQQKMKNAIWSAVPNIGMVVAGGSPVTMAISLASQVGIGYMNYRKAKSQNLLDKEKDEWQLQRSAMEQLNGLRRELFDTAWRLADRYQFPDRYRLTEPQIKRYNEILLDNNCLRRYERLEYMKDKFEAFPHFWYYLGAAANEVYEDTHYDAEVRARYRCYACEHYAKFLAQTERNLLREDQILAAGSLEYCGLLMSGGDADQDKKSMEGLVDRAIESAGSANDVLELCALTYLQLGATQKSARIFRMLVNDGYNQIVNAQLLSSIYVAEYIDSKSAESRDNYSTLRVRVGALALFPFPQYGNADKEELQAAFIRNQKDLLLGKCAFVLQALILKYSRQFANAMSPIDEKGGQDNRKGFLQVFNDLYSAIQGLPFVNKGEFYGRIAQELKSNSPWLSRDKGTPAVGFDTLTASAFKKVAARIKEETVSLADMAEIAMVESKIRAVCVSEGIPLPVLETEVPMLDEEETGKTENFESLLLKEDTHQQKARHAKREEMAACIQAHAEAIVTDESAKKKVFLYQEGDRDFDKYFGRHTLIAFSMKEKTLAIINNVTISDDDLLLTTDGVKRYVGLGWIRYVHPIIAYEKIKETNDRNCKLRLGIPEYQNKGVSLKELSTLFQELGDIQKPYKNEDDHSQDIDNMIASVLAELRGADELSLQDALESD